MLIAKSASSADEAVRRVVAFRDALFAARASAPPPGWWDDWCYPEQAHNERAVEEIALANDVKLASHGPIGRLAILRDPTRERPGALLHVDCVVHFHSELESPSDVLRQVDVSHGYRLDDDDDDAPILTAKLRYLRDPAHDGLPGLPGWRAVWPTTTGRLGCADYDEVEVDCPDARLPAAAAAPEETRREFEEFHAAMCAHLGN